MIGAQSAAMTARYAAWMAWPSQDLYYQSWVLYVLDRKRGQVTELDRAASAALPKPPSLPGYGSPVILGSSIYWPKVERAGAGYATRLFTCVIARCHPRSVAFGAAFPTASGSKVYWIDESPFRGHGAATRFTIRAYDPRTRTVTTVLRSPISKGAAVRGVGVFGDHLVWVADTGEGSRAHIVSLGSGHEVATVIGQPGIAFAAPVVTSDFAVLPDGKGGSGRSNGGYLYRFADHRLYAVGSARGLYAIHASGRCLTWQQRTGGTPAQPTVSLDTGCLK